MYNDRRYNLARYSVNLETAVVEIAETFGETLNSVAGVAIPVDTRERYSNTMRGYSRGTISVVSTMTAEAGLFAAAKMSANIVVKATAEETLSAAAAAIKNTPAALTSEDVLTAAARASKNIPEGMSGTEVLTALATASKDIYSALVVGDILTAIMDATSQTTETAVVEITIPPGGELRIDSDAFLVLLDGENVLYAQSGDWINVSRELLRLIIESATGGDLTGQLIYTERFL